MFSKQHLPRGNKRTGRSMKPEYITIHSTGNPKSTAQNERDYLTNPINTNSTGFHYVVGDNITIECIPPTEVSFHAGNSEGNSKSIGIEMVETGDRNKVIDNTVKLVADLQRQFKIPLKNVVRHYDWKRTNGYRKPCPRILMDDNWKGWWIFKSKLSNFEKPVVPKRDDSPSSWSKSSWDKATKKGVVDGNRPKDEATREEVITILDRLGVI